MQSERTGSGSFMTLAACLWLGVFPLLQFGSYRTITRDKWLCMLILTGFTIGCFLIDAFSRRISRPRILPLLFGAGLLVWTVISCVFSPLPGFPWWIGTGRQEGLVSRLCYLCLLFLCFCSRVSRRPVLVSAGCGVFVFFGVVLLQRTGGNPFGLYPDSGSYESVPSFQGTIGNVDMCSAYLVILFGMFLPDVIDTGRKMLPLSRTEQDSSAAPPVFRFCFLAAALACIVYLLLTIRVVSGLLALAVIGIRSFMRLLPGKARLPVLVVFLAAVMLLVWFWPGQGGVIWELHEILHGRLQFSFGSGRAGVWMRSIDMLRTEGRLLTGTGADTFAVRFNAFQNVFELSHPEAEFLSGYYDSPHCEYLALVSDCGIPALLCFLALILRGCRGAPGYRDSILGYGIQAFFSFSVCIVAPMFWVVLGLSLTASPEKRI